MKHELIYSTGMQSLPKTKVIYSKNILSLIHITENDTIVSILIILRKLGKLSYVDMTKVYKYLLVKDKSDYFLSNLSHETSDH